MTVSINGTNGLTFNDGSTQNTAATGFGFKNRIINGDMRIDQRNAGAAQNAINNGVYTVDRWGYYATQSGKFNAQQNAGSVTPPAGFSNYLGMTVASAVTVGASDRFGIFQPIEGHNMADFGWGTANAQAVTLSIWVRSSITGTHSGSVTNYAVTRSYPISFTISAANTWELKTVTIAGDTGGTWVGASNAGALYLNFNLGAGSSLSGTAGAWASAAYWGVTGAVSVVGTNGATFYITGVQLEKGSTATSFDSRDYGRELAMCQRYFEKSFAIDTAPANGVYSMGYLGYVCFADQWVFAIPTILFKVPKRSAPTLSYFGTSTNTWQLNDNNNNWQNQAAIGQFQGTIGTYTTGFSVGVHNNGNSGYAIGSARMIRGDWTASSEL